MKLLAEWSPPARPARPAGREPQLLAVAMMRHGDKLASYRGLAAALSCLADRPWRLDIVGDGDARREVERLFAPFSRRVRLHGQVADRSRLAALYRAADLFVWPAVNEAYGMVFLEAQAFGCPVVAGAHPGVESVVRDGETGLLTRPGDAGAFAAAVAALLDDDRRRHGLGLAAQRLVADEHDLGCAAGRLRAALMPLIAERATP